MHAGLGNNATDKSAHCRQSARAVKQMPLFIPALHMHGNNTTAKSAHCRQTARAVKQMPLFIPALHMHGPCLYLEWQYRSACNPMPGATASVEWGPVQVGLGLGQRLKIQAQVQCTVTET